MGLIAERQHQYASHQAQVQELASDPDPEDPRRHPTNLLYKIYRVIWCKNGSTLARTPTFCWDSNEWCWFRDEMAGGWARDSGEAMCMWYVRTNRCI